jgi:hypothetical protein
MAHDWQNDPAGTTDTDVLWRCSKCSQVAGFNRKGIGEPFASETEHPDNIDDYVSPCEEVQTETVARARVDAISVLSYAIMSGTSGAALSKEQQDVLLASASSSTIAAAAAADDVAAEVQG